MVYERHVFYLEYWKKASRIGTFGYVMVWHKDREYGMKISVDGLHKKYDGVFDCLVLDEEARRLTTLTISAGQGTVTLSALDPENVEGTGYRLYGIKELQIILGDEERLICKLWNEKEESGKEEREKVKEEALKKEALKKETLNKETLKKETLKKETLEEVTLKKETLEEVTLAGEPFGVEPVREEVRKEDKEFFMAESVGTERNKWEQLQEVYEHIRPFHDEREYLSIGIGDFLVLSEKSYGLTYNSFLLHGFYHYHHLILHKDVKGKKERYYVGVPGVFQEKERRAAVMYGFEGFESKYGDINQGDFGYYMIAAEL